MIRERENLVALLKDCARRFQCSARIYGHLMKRTRTSILSAD
jgi:hypothetical protein